jgi:hypothetical protein
MRSTRAFSEALRAAADSVMKLMLLIMLLALPIPCSDAFTAACNHKSKAGPFAGFGWGVKKMPTSFYDVSWTICMKVTLRLCIPAPRPMCRPQHLSTRFLVDAHAHRFSAQVSSTRAVFLNHSWTSPSRSQGMPSHALFVAESRLTVVLLTVVRSMACTTAHFLLTVLGPPVMHTVSNALQGFHNRSHDTSTMSFIVSYLYLGLYCRNHCCVIITLAITNLVITDFTFNERPNRDRACAV